MTAQIPDKLVLADQVLSMAGVNGGELFNPSRFGLRPYPSFTACWRGHICQYAVRGGRLVLDELQVSLMAPAAPGEPREPRELAGQVGPAINGVSPIFPNSHFAPLNNLYQELNLPVPFTGGLLAGADFIQELYVHMGFHPAWKYKTVFELIVFDGQVSEVRDVSQGLAKIRGVMAGRPLRPDLSTGDQDIRAWIESTFKLSYDL